MRRFLLSSIVILLLLVVGCEADAPIDNGEKQPIATPEEDNTVLDDLDRVSGRYDEVYPISGSVKDTFGNPIEGVVISDGVYCTRSDSDGAFYMGRELANTKFITASIPSGYKAPNNEKGLPQFYHRVTDSERNSNRCTIHFVFEPIAGNADRYTILIGADPQPRAKTHYKDRFAFHSLDICEDLYRDMRETATAITDRCVYGLMLGDIVHENMSLFDNYIEGISTINCQMFNVLGNHDHDKSATSDEEGARGFEDKLGPSYYSFNIGKQHFVVLDNCIMAASESGISGVEKYGLTDRMWQWLQNDLKYVDYSTTIMVAAHAPMFRKQSRVEASNSAQYGKEYAALLSKYKKVHAWAGHTHSTHNYCYPESSSYKNIEVHTLARSTGGLLYTNDYCFGGTPRGYTIVEVDGEDIRWYFNPTKYQAEWIGSKYSYTQGQPDYAHRDWSYNEDGVAMIGDKPLDSTYQMKLYAPGLYEEEYLYANIFLWDSKWATPQFNGREMELLEVEESYDYGYISLRKFYFVNCTYYSNTYSEADADATGHLSTLFRVKIKPNETSGEVSVVDRFGNRYNSTISW